MTENFGSFVIPKDAFLEKKSIDSKNKNAVEEKDEKDDKNKKRKRQRMPKELSEILNAEFNKNMNPTSEVKEKIAKQTGIEVRKIQVWFQNKRAKVAKNASKSSKDKNSELANLNNSNEKNDQNDLNDKNNLNKSYYEEPQPFIFENFDNNSFLQLKNNQKSNLNHNDFKLFESKLNRNNIVKEYEFSVEGGSYMENEGCSSSEMPLEHSFDKLDNSITLLNFNDSFEYEDPSINDANGDYIQKINNKELSYLNNEIDKNNGGKNINNTGNDNNNDNKNMNKNNKKNNFKKIEKATTNNVNNVFKSNKGIFGEYENNEDSNYNSFYSITLKLIRMHFSLLPQQNDMINYFTNCALCSRSNFFINVINDLSSYSISSLDSVSIGSWQITSLDSNPILFLLNLNNNDINYYFEDISSKIQYRISYNKKDIEEAFILTNSHRIKEDDTKLLDMDDLGFDTLQIEVDKLPEISFYLNDDWCKDLNFSDTVNPTLVHKLKGPALKIRELINLLLI